MKLEHYGVRGKELSWFTSYLTNGVQAVDVDGRLSKPQVVKMGVPQGSVLGPILFLIYINDFYKSLEADVAALLFADDTTLQLTSKNINHLYIKANYNLRLAEEWFNCNLLSLNTKKTKYMLFTLKIIIYIIKAYILQEMLLRELVKIVLPPSHSNVWELLLMTNLTGIIT